MRESFTLWYKRDIWYIHSLNPAWKIMLVTQNFKVALKNLRCSSKSVFYQIFQAATSCLLTTLIPYIGNNYGQYRDWIYMWEEICDSVFDFRDCAISKQAIHFEFVVKQQLFSYDRHQAFYYHNLNPLPDRQSDYMMVIYLILLWC